ncbi:MAG: ABC transporter substrate-binding protein [Anaerolineaceae bacterium]
MKRFGTIFLLLTLLLSACSQAVQTQAPQQAAPIALIDALGREVKLEKLPQRIAVTGRASLMILDALYLFPEAKERVVAFEDAVQGDLNFIELLDPKYPEKAFLKRDAGVEQFVTAEPDLVIMKSSQAEKFGAPIEALNIPVVYLDFETPEQYTRDLTLIGQILGNPDRAQELNRAYQNAVDEINQKVPVSASRPGVLVLQYDSADGAVAFKVPPASWMQTLLVQMAGGSPLWLDANAGAGWAQVSIEQVAAWDPDVVLVIAYAEDPSAVTATLKQDPQWQQLRAVKDGKLYGFPKDVYSWDQPDTRWLLGLQWLAARLHPEVFSQVDLEQTARDFYQFAYEIDAATYDANLLPITQGDLR